MVLGRFWQRLGAAGGYVSLASPSGALPKLLLQRVGEGNQTVSRG
jgi:hypothetical protein